MRPFDIGDDPGSVLGLANTVLSAEAPNGMFVTLLLVKFGASDGRIRYSNAGNSRPLLYRSNGDAFTDLGTSGFPLGIDPDFQYGSAEEDLAPGDFLLLYTDGLTDANDSQLDLFGRDRLLAALRDASRLPASEMRERLRSAVAAFIGTTPLYDDVTFVIARRTA